MSKKRIEHKNIPSLISVTSSASQESLALYKRRSRVWVYINPAVSFIAIIIIFANLNFYRTHQTDGLLEFFRLFSAPILVLLFVLKMKLTKRLIAFISAKEYENQTRSLGNSFWINVLFLTLTLFPLVHESILIKEVSSYVAYYLPQLGQIILGWILKLVAFLASTGFSILGNLLLGVLGNFIYDLIKERFSRGTHKK